jgi:hypothetical protein
MAGIGCVVGIHKGSSCGLLLIGPVLSGSGNALGNTGRRRR